MLEYNIPILDEFPSEWYICVYLKGDVEHLRK